jgi:hypothetical protein
MFLEADHRVSKLRMRGPTSLFDVHIVIFLLCMHMYVCTKYLHSLLQYVCMYVHIYAHMYMYMSMYMYIFTYSFIYESMTLREE